MSLSVLEFVKKAGPIMSEELSTAGLTEEAKKLSLQFLKIKFDRGEAENIRKACRESIFEASVYYANILGEDPTLGGSVVCVNLNK